MQRKSNIESTKAIENFCDLIKDITETEEFCKMRSCRHQVHGSTHELFFSRQKVNGYERKNYECKNYRRFGIRYQGRLC